MSPETLPIEHLRTLRATLDIGPISLTALTPLERLAAAVCQLSCILIDEAIKEKQAKGAYASGGRR